MQTDKKRNPLKLLNAFFILASVLYLLYLLPKIFSEGMLVEITGNLKIKILGLGLCLSFIICYYRKSILAWWIGMWFVAIMFASNMFLKNHLPNQTEVLTFFVIYFFYFIIWGLNTKLIKNMS